MVHGRPSMMLGAGGIAGLRIIDTISLRDDHLAANSEIASRQQSAPSASAVASERIADLAAARYAIYMGNHWLAAVGGEGGIELPDGEFAP